MGKLIPCQQCKGLWPECGCSGLCTCTASGDRCDAPDCGIQLPGAADRLKTLLEIQDMLGKYQRFFSEKALRVFVAPGVHSTLMIIEEHQGRAALMSPIDLDAIKRTVVRCHYLSKIVPIADEFQGVATLSNIINALAEEGLIWGWLAKPSSLELFNPAPGHGDFNPLKGLPAVNEAVFCFIFTKLSDAEFEARFPGWICAEGSVGKPL